MDKRDGRKRRDIMKGYADQCAKIAHAYRQVVEEHLALADMAKLEGYQLMENRHREFARFAFDQVRIHDAEFDSILDDGSVLSAESSARAGKES